MNAALKTKTLNAANSELLQGNPFTDSRRPAMARERELIRWPYIS